MLPLIQNIRTIRKQKGISQESVAYDLGIDYSTYGKIERGQIALTVDRLEKIAEILGVTVADLYKWDQPAGKPSGVKEEEEADQTFKDYRFRINNLQVEVETLQREIGLLQRQLKDKEKIIELLENKLNKDHKGLSL